MEKIFTAGRLVIVGAGGFGREVLDVVDAINASGGAIEFLGFLDDGPVNKDLLEVRGATVLGGSDRIGALDCAYVVGVVDPSVRRRIDGPFLGRAIASRRSRASIGNCWLTGVTWPREHHLCSGVYHDQRSNRSTLPPQPARHRWARHDYRFLRHLDARGESERFRCAGGRCHGRHRCQRDSEP